MLLFELLPQRFAEEFPQLNFLMHEYSLPPHLPEDLNDAWDLAGFEK